MICAAPTSWRAEGMYRKVFDMFLEKAESETEYERKS